MKTGTPDHPKTKALARMLKAPRCVAIGVLEALWHATAKFAPRGDIGRFSDEEIADLCFWEDGAPLLISALVGAGWLDAHSRHRLVVHDWHEHAEDAVQMRLARAGERFVNRAVPKMGRLTAEEKAVAQRKYDGNAKPVRAHGKRTTNARCAPCLSPPLPSPPIPSPAILNPGPTSRKPRVEPVIGITHSASGWAGITDRDRAEWATAYPACDIDRQLAAMTAWIKSAGPRGHKKSWRKFIVGWLSRSQDKGGDGHRLNGTGRIADPLDAPANGGKSSLEIYEEYQKSRAL